MKIRYPVCSALAIAAPLFLFAPATDSARVATARALVGPNHMIMDVLDTAAAPVAKDPICAHGTYAQITAHPPEGYHEMPRLDSLAQAKVIRLYNDVPPHSADVPANTQVHVWLGKIAETEQNPARIDTVLFLVEPESGCSLSMAHLTKPQIDYLFNGGPMPQQPGQQDG